MEYHCGACRSVFRLGNKKTNHIKCPECFDSDTIYMDEEFYCGECQGYFDQKLRINVSGNHTIQCPVCDHHHYRYIENGLITEKRCNAKAGQLDIIVALKAKYRKIPRHSDPEFRRSQMKNVKIVGK